MSEHEVAFADLLDCWQRLDDGGRELLSSFAEFLATRRLAEGRRLLEPVPVPRPDAESVVAALKRLSRVYHMLDRSKMLTETSALMSEHVMEGRSAAEVIDDLEALFERHWRRQAATGTPPAHPG